MNVLLFLAVYVFVVSKTTNKHQSYKNVLSHCVSAETVCAVTLCDVIELSPYNLNGDSWKSPGSGLTPPELKTKVDVFVFVFLIGGTTYAAPKNRELESLSPG